jgi:phospholipid/cholesterol/gamma-HCH transport system ATP-binding protein
MSAGRKGEAIIEVEGLDTRFGDNVIHENLDLTVRRGEVIGIVGGSGTGKSVLLRTILGLKQPDAGRIRVFGLDFSTLPEAERRLNERRWGVLFQDGALFSALTVAENIQVPYREHLDLSQELMDELAGGMRKRAGLARALALDPEILFLDEPTAGLDPIGAAAFDELLNDLKETLGLTVFLVTHDLDTLHATCDRIAVLAEKHVILVGTIDDMLRSSHPWIHEYFHGPRARAALAGK